MREIKFRAWDEENNVMVYSDKESKRIDYWDGIETGYVGMVNFQFKNSGLNWMQFTGLKDVNGKEIYEGDVLSGGGIPYKQTVDFLDGCFFLRGKYSRRFLGEELQKYKLEIIGNIYENPEPL